MADLRPQHDEEVVAANHPTKADVTNRAWNVEHAEDGTHKAGMFGTGLAGGAGTPVSVDGIVEVGASAELKVKVIDIGNWDMDITAFVAIAHGLTITDIRCVTALIRSDTGDLVPIDYDLGTGAWGRLSVGTASVTLTRTAAGGFDGVNYDSIPYNRGWIRIWYLA